MRLNTPCQTVTNNTYITVYIAKTDKKLLQKVCFLN